MALFKKIVGIMLAALVSLGTVGALAGCGENGGSNTIDSSKTQLYIRCYQGGFGNKWLYNGKDKFEELYKNVSLEEDKTGVQVIITDKKETPDIANIKNDDFELYFVEKMQYLYLIEQDVIEDLTDVLTKPNKYDGKVIVDKLTAEQRNFFGVNKDGSTKYYALPNYVAPNGIIYDIDLFEGRGYYFIDGYENETDINNKFIIDENDKKSKGPDGEYNTADDGLPATYADFWDLCEYIYLTGDVPLNWGGKNDQFYITALMVQLMADYCGKDQFMLNATFDGVMEDLVKIENGQIVFNEDGTPVLESVELNPELLNGYETFRSVSYYYALGFVNKLMEMQARYSNSNNTLSQSYTAFDAQDDYVMSRHSSGMKRQAMIIEGSWWENESTGAFEDMVSLYKDAAKKENCRYGWLPLPKANKEQVEKKVKSTMFNNMDSLCFVKKGLPEIKKQLALDFVQLMHTDEALVDFTVTTNTFKDFQYTLTNEQVAGLTPFAKDFYAKLQNYDVISLRHDNYQYYNTLYRTDATRRYAISSTDEFPNITFRNHKKTVEEYFVETIKYIKQNTPLWANK